MQTERTDCQTSQRAILAAAFALFIGVGVLATTGFVLDDAFITFRYAKHLAELGSATWNSDGSDGVHPGFTTILWMAASALWTALVHDGSRVLACARVTSAVATLVAAFLVAGRLVRLKVPFTLAIGYGALVFGNWSLGLHINSGMETTLFATLVLAVLWSRDEPRPHILSYALALVATLVRPEGMICALVLIAVDARHRRWRTVVLGAALVVLVLAAVAAALHFTYGSALPSALYVKGGAPRPKGSSIRSISVFVVLYALVPLVACIRVARKDPVAGLALTLSGALFALLSFVYPIMNPQGRYEWPALFLLAYGGSGALRTPARRDAWVGVVGFAGTVWSSAQSVCLSSVNRAEYDDNRFVGLALATARARGPLVLVDAGAVPYYADVQARDVIGLADGRIDQAHKRWGDIACDPPVRNAVFYSSNEANEVAVLERCGFHTVILRPYVCNDAWSGVAIFSRDADTLARLPFPEPARDGCVYTHVWPVLFMLDTQM